MGEEAFCFYVDDMKSRLINSKEDFVRVITTIATNLENDDVPIFFAFMRHDADFTGRLDKEQLEAFLGEMFPYVDDNELRESAFTSLSESFREHAATGNMEIHEGPDLMRLLVWFFNEASCDRGALYVEHMWGAQYSALLEDWIKDRTITDRAMGVYCHMLKEVLKSKIWRDFGYLPLPHNVFMSNDYVVDYKNGAPADGEVHQVSTSAGVLRTEPISSFDTFEEVCKQV